MKKISKILLKYFRLYDNMYTDMTVQYPSFSVPSESGPKNPLKGISVKLLVLASYAQLGVSAGSTLRSLNCEGCGVRANRNGIR